MNNWLGVQLWSENNKGVHTQPCSFKTRALLTIIYHPNRWIRIPWPQISFWFFEKWHPRCCVISRKPTHFPKKKILAKHSSMHHLSFFSFSRWGDVWLEWMQMSRRERFNIKSKSLKEAQQTIANAEHAYQHQRRQRQVGMGWRQWLKNGRDYIGVAPLSEFWMLWQVRFWIY